MSLAEQLQRPHLKSVTPYASARRSMSGGSVWLNANESPYANSFNVTTDQLNRYPSFQPAPLLKAYASYAGLTADQVLAARGSDEAIDLLIRTFCEPGSDSIIICPPTYGMYAIAAATHGAQTIEVPLLSTWQLDLPKIQANAAAAKLIFVCNPSNPLGNQLNEQSLRELLATTPNTLVVVDEAYIEFSSSVSTTAWLAEFPQLVILRTLSKAFALAGIRCGFALANVDIIQALQKVLAPYPLPDLTVQIATEALSKNGLMRTQAQVQAIVKERLRVQEKLSAFNFVQDTFNSVTNFILLQVEDAAALVQHCQQAGVLIRDQSRQRGLANVVRISIGTALENDALLAAFATYTEETQS